MNSKRCLILWKKGNCALGKMHARIKIMTPENTSENQHGSPIEKLSNGIDLSLLKALATSPRYPSHLPNPP